MGKAVRNYFEKQARLGIRTSEDSARSSEKKFPVIHPIQREGHNGSDDSDIFNRANTENGNVTKLHEGSLHASSGQRAELGTSDSDNSYNPPRRRIEG